MTRWLVASLLAIGLVLPARAETADGRYAGTGAGLNLSGNGKTSCPPFDIQMTVRAGKISGEAKRTLITNHVVKPETLAVTGEVTPQGGVRMRVGNWRMSGTLAGSQLRGTSTGTGCEYRFELARAG
jgi:hypothetical protein